MVWGGRCLKIKDVCMDFEPNFRVHNLIYIYPKSIKLGQMINLNMIFHVVVSVYRLVKIWNSPQFRVEFRNGLFRTCSVNLFNLVPRVFSSTIFKMADRREKTLAKAGITWYKISKNQIFITWHFEKGQNKMAAKGKQNTGQRTLKLCTRSSGGFVVR